MSEPRKRTKATPRRAKLSDQSVARASPRDAAAATAASSINQERPSLGALTGDQLNELNSQLRPALDRALHFDAQWSVWSARGDYVAALATGLAAAVCRSAVEVVRGARSRVREVALLMEDIDRPLASNDCVEDGDGDETSAEALDRLVTDIVGQHAETVTPLAKAVHRLGDKSIEERAKRIRACSEWSNPNGILCNHPPSACVELFCTLLVSPVVYMDGRDEIMAIARFRGEASAFRARIKAFEAESQARTKEVDAAFPFNLPGLSYEQTDQFRDWLDAVCAGDLRMRHGKKDSERVYTIRDIAEHFRCFLEIPRTTAREAFKVEPWSTGLAALARAALNYKVSTEDVRGALKNWGSD